MERRVRLAVRATAPRYGLRGLAVCGARVVCVRLERLDLVWRERDDVMVGVERWCGECGQ